MCSDVIRVGLGDEEFKGQVLHLCSVVLLSGEFSYLHYTDTITDSRVNMKEYATLGPFWICKSNLP